MKRFIIYYNANCSKSRKALEILKENQINPLIIEYLKTPLSLEELSKLKSHFALTNFIRTDEPVFKKLNLNLENEDKVLAAMQANPILMQRPIVTYNGRAIIARPPEKVLELIK